MYKKVFYSSTNISMNNSTNTLTAQNTVRATTKYMDRVVDACNQLIWALEANKDEVTSFGIKVTDNVMKNEYVDRVLGYLELLKKLTIDLKKYAHTHFTDEKAVKDIIEHLNVTSDKLHAKMIENNFFFEHYSLKVLEITQTIKRIQENLPIKA